MLIEHLKAIFQAVNQPLLLLGVAIVSGIIVLGFIKLLNHQRFGYVELFSLLVIAGIFIFFYPLNNLFKYLLNFALVLLLFYSAYSYYLIHKRQNLRRERIIHHLKNVNFDYYYSTNAKDKIVDASVSFSTLTGLTLSEIKKEKGINLLLKNFDITKIAGKEASETVLAAFQNDYHQGIKPHQFYKFEIEALVKGKLKVIVV